MTKTFFLTLGLFLLALAGCTKLYPTPEVDRSANFLGIRDLVPPGQTARLVLSHGMCSGMQGEKWVRKRIALIDDLVNDRATDSTKTDDRKLTPRESRNGAIRLYEATVSGTGNRRYELSLFVWGGAVDQARRNLDQDSGRAPTEGKPRRAAVNSFLRDGLMNDCLIDAVFYLGPAGDVIREGMRELWCDFLGGKVDRYNGDLDSFSTCRVGAPRKGADNLAFLIPESLGSKILFDAYRQVQVTGMRKARALGPVGGIHLVTNQILLLDQAGFADAQRTAAASNRSSLSSFLDQIETPSTDRMLSLGARAKGGDGRVPVVAYTDPNDVLGYRLFEAQNPNSGRFDVINVLLSNSGTAIPLVPIVANPERAHRGAEDNARLFELIIDGADRQNQFD